MRILALDLGKNKTADYLLDRQGDKHQHTTVRTSPACRCERRTLSRENKRLDDIDCRADSWQQARCPAKKEILMALSIGACNHYVHL